MSSDLWRFVKKNIVLVLSLAVSLTYLGLRLPNFPQKTTFLADQGLHLIESKQMIDRGDIRLIGPMVTSKTFSGRGFFIGPQYYYVLALAGVITKWDPLAISYLLFFSEFVILTLFIYWLGRTKGWFASLIVFFTIAVSPYLIVHSRFIWNPHFLFTLGLMCLWLLDSFIKRKNIYLLFLIGVVWGTAFGFHYSGVIWAVWLLPILLTSTAFKEGKNILIKLSLLAGGFVVGDLPFFIFELKHNFYNLRTIWLVITKSNGGGPIQAHYLIYPLIPLIIIISVYLINRFKKQRVIIGLVIVTVITASQVSVTREHIPLNSPTNWNYPTAVSVAEKILENGCPGNYEVAETISGDTRAYELRFLLALKKCPPMDVESYPSASVLYLIAPVDRPPQTDNVWEVTSMGKAVSYKMQDINDTIELWEVTKK